MQVVVKKPRIRIEGEVTAELVEYLRKEYGEIEVITDEEEELVEVTESEWYRSLRRSISPGENVRLYRKLHGLTQEELGTKLGNFTRQNISNIENGHRAVSKNMAIRLAELFDVSVEKFL
jgi:DNA-binding XRE family transcriptional regulator